MRKILAISLALSATLAGAAASAQDNIDSESTVGETDEVTGRNGLKDELIGIKPQVGALSTGGTTQDSRLAFGFTADMNLAFSNDRSMNNWYIGPSTGLIFSNRGAPGSDFFGSNDGGGGDSASILLIPADLKLGYNFSPGFRLSAHGGVNAIYRSNVSQIAVGGDTGGTGSDWGVFPNIGADFEFGLGQNFGLIIRPDVTITSGNDVYTFTIGFNAIIG